jgi:TolA-binding protein
MHCSGKFDKSNLAQITNSKALIERTGERLGPDQKISSRTEFENYPVKEKSLLSPLPMQERIEQEGIESRQSMASLRTELGQCQQRVLELEQLLQETQQQSNRQSQQLQTLEAVCQDLRSCLQRQRRQTLEFKAAVEKCMLMSTQSDLGQEVKPNLETEREFCIPLPMELTLNQSSPPSRLSRPTAPIHPWQSLKSERISIQPESFPETGQKNPISKSRRSRSQVQLPSFPRP